LSSRQNRKGYYIDLIFAAAGITVCGDYRQSRWGAHFFLIGFSGKGEEIGGGFVLGALRRMSADHICGLKRNAVFPPQPMRLGFNRENVTFLTRKM